MSAAKVLEINDGMLEETLIDFDVTHGIGVTANLVARDVVAIVKKYGLLHIVQTQSLHFDQEMKAARTMIDKPQKFFKHPLRVICGSANLIEGKSFSFTFEVGAAKETMLEDVAAFLDETSATRRISDRVLLAADEFYTNAARNGWAKPAYSSSHGAGDPRGPVERPGRIEIFGHVGSDRLILGCRDTYGLLDPAQVVSRLDACFTKGVTASIRRGPGGAGIGSYLVFETGLSYYAGVHQNQTTVVCVAFAIGSSARAENEPAKSIHLVRL